MAIKTELIEVTPDMAVEWLQQNPDHQRKLRTSHVRQLARAMSNGGFKMTGEPIIFSGTQLLDGQHRLAACVQADAPFTTLIVRGVHRDTFAQMNTGRSRGHADILHIDGIPNARLVASIGRIIWQSERDTKRSGAHTLAIYSMERPTPADVLKLVRTDPAVTESADFIATVKSGLRNLVPPAIAGSLYYYFAQQDEDKAQAFFTEVATGVNIAVDSPTYMLRKRFLDAVTARHKKFSAIDTAALVIIAWNHYRDGRKMSSQGLRYRRQGDRPDAFPSWL